MIVVGDCVAAMRDMDVESVDAIVTDPPYGLSFMGKKWDYDVPGVEAFAEMLRVLKPGGRLLCFAGTRTMHRMWCNIEDAGFTIEDTIAWMYGSGFPKHRSKLKPAYEPICVARKPAPRASALNIDECRSATPGPRGGDPAGRWPANVVLDEEAAQVLDEQSGQSQSSDPQTPRRTALGRMNDDGWEPSLTTRHGFIDAGGASRFFYCAKASRRERGEGNHHPTVKPIELMRWLVRLVTPAGGVVLDPFAGSGTTGVAAVLEGREFIGIEREAEYAEIARRRIRQCTETTALDLFAERTPSETLRKRVIAVDIALRAAMAADTQTEGESDGH